MSTMTKAIKIVYRQNSCQELDSDVCVKIYRHTPRYRVSTLLTINT